MEVIATPRLQEYMQSHNIDYVAIEPIICRSWAGSHIEVAEIFAAKEEDQLLIAKSHRRYPITSGEVLIAPQGLWNGDTVRLDLTKFLWRKIITVEGIMGAH